MAIHTEEKKDMQAGFMKTIDESGIMMMFDVLQRYQYSYPVKSTVRELLSNGIDSVVEKNMAISILTGKAKPSDYFVDLEGEIYRDSKYTPEYYDLNWLNTSDDKVKITYIEGSKMGKDKVIISDPGVGLGGTRLEKYFRLGFSTKRLSKLPLGKFGVGAKSPLSIGAECYTMESRYNGRLYRFNIYSHTIDSIIPQFNLEKNEENGFVLFNEGTDHEYKVYYESTTDKNGVNIILDAKKHHKQQYIDAVKSQMLYFDNIICAIQNEDGNQEIIEYRANILYEDQYIVMSDNNYFTQPHLLLNKVSYGLIDWNELELETKRGNIGIKVAPEDVEVNPSRESVLWTEKTKSMVLNRFRDVVGIAGGMIQEELKETDLIKWFKVCSQVSRASWGQRNSILSRLASIVDLSKVELKFPLYEKLVYKDNVLPVMTKQVEFGERKSSTTGEVIKIIRRSSNPNPKHDGWFDINSPIILMGNDERASNRKDKYLLSLYKRFNVAYEPYNTKERMEENATEEEKAWYIKGDISFIMRAEVWDFLCKSTEVLHYSKIEVPESFTGTEEEPVEEEEEVVKEEEAKAKVIAQSAAERRKLEGKTLVYMLESEYGERVNNNKGIQIATKAFEFTKIEIPFTEINTWDHRKVYYGNEADSALINFIAFITRDSEDPMQPKRSYANDYHDWEKTKWYRLNKKKIDELKIYDWKAYRMQHYFDSRIILIKVAQSANRYYRDFNKVQEFFTVIKNKTITVSNLLIQWNTARVIRNRLIDAAFLYNFEQFNPLYYTMYRKLCEDVDKHYREVGDYAKSALHGLDQVTYDDLLNHLNNIQRFQEFVMSNQSDAEGIASLAGKLFMGNTGIQDGMAVDPEIMSMTSQVIEYARACGDMLNYIPSLTGIVSTGKPVNLINSKSRVNSIIDGNLVMEISQYLEYRGVPIYNAGIDQGIPELAQDVEQEF